MAKKTMKVGVVGYGPQFRMGWHHLNLMAQNDGFVPTAVCDVSEAQLEAARQDFSGIETYADVRQMLRKSEVELLAIILPHHLHAPVALQCLRAGRHVVVEKPFAITLSECDRMIEAAAKSKVMLSAYHNRHWDANILTIMKHLKKIGRPYRWESQHGNYAKPRDWWRSDKKVAGGAIYDWGAHYTEWMLQVMPYEMAEISGFQVNDVWPEVSLEDEVTAVVRFKGEALATHTQTSIDMGPKPNIRIAGSKGTIVATHSSVEIHTVRPDGTRQVECPPMEQRDSDAYYKNVHAHLFKGEELVITAEHARRVIQVLYAATRSANSGKAVKAVYA